MEASSLDLMNKRTASSYRQCLAFATTSQMSSSAQSWSAALHVLSSVCGKSVGHGRWQPAKMSQAACFVINAEDDGVEYYGNPLTADHRARWHLTDGQWQDVIHSGANDYQWGLHREEVVYAEELGSVRLLREMGTSVAAKRSRVFIFRYYPHHALRFGQSSRGRGKLEWKLCCAISPPGNRQKLVQLGPGMTLTLSDAFSSHGKKMLSSRSSKPQISKAPGTRPSRCDHQRRRHTAHRLWRVAVGVQNDVARGSRARRSESPAPPNFLNHHHQGLRMPNLRDA
ncbi:hypothetical protein U1Q18_044788 [Sarracenia purpurea var. burkii]